MCCTFYRNWYIESQIQEAQDIQISFLPIVIQANVQGKGTISPSDTIPLEKGKNQTFSIIPDMGYFIDQLVIDGEAVSPQDTFTFWDIHTAHTIDVTFEAQDPITLTVTMGGLQYKNSGNRWGAFK